MSKATNRILTIEPVRESSAAVTAGSFRARSAGVTRNAKAEQDRGVKTSAVRTERFRIQPVNHS